MGLNTLNLIVLQKVNGSKVVMDILITLNQTKGELQDPEMDKVSERLVERLMTAASVILRNEDMAVKFLLQNKFYIGSIINNIKVHKKNDRITKPSIMIIRLLLVNEESVNLFKQQFPGLNGLIKIILGSSMCDFVTCTHLMFSKFQMENKGGKAAKNSDDEGLDDILVKKFYADFKADPENAKQVAVIEALKTKEGFANDEDFIMHLISVGEHFMVVDQAIAVKFQIEIEDGIQVQYGAKAKQIKDQYGAIAAQYRDAGYALMLDEYSDSEEEDDELVAGQ